MLPLAKKVGEAAASFVENYLAKTEYRNIFVSNLAAKHFM
jgi:hypothetical protein